MEHFGVCFFSLEETIFRKPRAINVLLRSFVLQLNQIGIKPSHLYSTLKSHCWGYFTGNWESSSQERGLWVPWFYIGGSPVDQLVPRSEIRALGRVLNEYIKNVICWWAPQVTIFIPCIQAGLSRCKRWPSLQMLSFVSTPMYPRHPSKSSHHPTCSGLVTQLICHPSGFWIQSLNPTHPENVCGKQSLKCACIQVPEIDWHHFTTTPKGTAWTKLCGKWWTEWKEKS